MQRTTTIPRRHDCELCAIEIQCMRVGVCCSQLRSYVTPPIVLEAHLQDEHHAILSKFHSHRALLYFESLPIRRPGLESDLN